MNLMSKDSNYSVKEDINYNLPSGCGGYSSRPSDNNNNGKHDGGNLCLDNPNDPFAFDSDGIADDNELHMWSNIAGQEYLSNMNAHPATPTMIIPNVLVTLEPDVHENIVAKPNVDEFVEEYGTEMDVDETQPPASHIHPSSDGIFPPTLPTWVKNP